MHQSNAERAEFDTSPRITHFMVTGLHESRTIRLDFGDPHSIFIADNGAGKTTALYLLQSVLKQDWMNLPRFDFHSIEVSFNTGNVFRILRTELIGRPWMSAIQRIRHKAGINPSEIQKLLDLTTGHSLEAARNHPEFYRVARRMAWPSSRLYDFLSRYKADYQESAEGLFSDSSDLERLRHFIRDHLDIGVIYLPTYRRVEQELRHLVSKEDGNDESFFNTSIQFGMKDVERKLEVVGKSIRDHFALTYSSISGQMLHQLTRETTLSPIMLERLADREAVEAVLARLSNFISKEDSDHILMLLDNGQLISNNHLAFFLYNLIMSYKDVSTTEESLQDFAERCNSYLIEKEFRYNPSSASLKLYASGTEPMDLSAMSSGEKQVVGVMSQIYLGKNSRYVVIFDEPELSLSVEWQRKILPDIARSPKCWSLIAATHSPFIFDNELDFSARNMQYFPFQSEAPR